MWWRRLIRPLLLAALAAWAIAPAAAQNRPQVKLLFEPEANPPRTLGDGTAIDWQKPGLTLELLRLVGERVGVDFVYERMPWKRALYLIETNEADGVFHASFLPERTAIAVYPMKDNRADAARAVFVQSYALYKRAGSPVEWDGTALTGADAPVGVTIHYSVLHDLKRLGVPVEEAKTLEQNLDKLAGGRIAAYAGLEGRTDPVIAANPAKYRQLVKMSPPLVTKPYYLLFSHGFYEAHRDLAERIWNAVAAIGGSAEFAEIAGRYLD
ncbi:MAG TPA: transporter substrate-binding domain-containing protein [Azospirillum sp.]|nr:transporter substrate-binding domain-containing protein [Azospirillum sp.]